jgi:O2-independent ubiquinone biosynthesis accessory factor UbiT
MQVPPLVTLPLSLMPLPVLETATRMLFSRILKTHPGLFSRLGEYESKRFAFSPSDLPLTFVINPAKPEIHLYRKQDAPLADSNVEAPLFTLLALLEGHLDADALFFSRDLTVTGDMEAMLAMRNALDDFDIDLPRDLAAIGGPLGPLFQRAANHIRRHALSEEAA